MSDEWEEVRRVFYEARKKNPPKEKEKRLVTAREYVSLRKSGADMSRYEVLRKFMDRMGKLDRIERKTQRELKDSVATPKSQV